ncbi:MAG TPA: carbohydrate-binding protein, partial [Cellvibrio sp.]
ATQYTITIKTRDGAHNLSAASAPLVITTLPESQCAGNAWNAATAYTTGQKASYGGTLYEAKWWTQNQRPDLNSGQWGVWKVVGPC